MRRLTTLASALALAACSPKPQSTPDTPQPAPGVMCTMEARPAIQVTVLDQQGGRLPAGTNVRVIAKLEYLDTSRNPARPATPYADTASVVTAGDSTTVALAHERPGVYMVNVSAAGFQAFTWWDVYVAKTPDGCHVQTRGMEARLRR